MPTDNAFDLNLNRLHRNWPGYHDNETRQHRESPEENVMRLISFLANVLLLSCISTLSTAALSPTFEADRLLLEAEDLISQQQYSAAQNALSRARTLRRDLPSQFYFLQGQVSQALKKPAKALASYETYIELAGRNAPEYFETLRLITDLKKQTNAPKSNKQSSPVAELAWSEQQLSPNEYHQYLQFLYQTDNTLAAITQHINNLLAFYQYGDPSIVSSNRIDGAHKHSISVKLPATLITSTQDLTHRKKLTTNDRFSVYGINPYLRYSCQHQNASCQLRHPKTGQLWLEISNNEPAAQELTRALSSLMKLLQLQRS